MTKSKAVNMPRQMEEKLNNDATMDAGSANTATATTAVKVLNSLIATKGWTVRTVGRDRRFHHRRHPRHRR